MSLKERLLVHTLELRVLKPVNECVCVAWVGREEGGNQSQPQNTSKPTINFLPHTKCGQEEHALSHGYMEKITGVI